MECSCHSCHQGLIKNWVHSGFLPFPSKISQDSFLMPWKNDFIVHWGNDGKETPRVVLQHLHFSPGQILLNQIEHFQVFQM